MRLAREEYARFTDQLRALGRDEWRRPTCCAAWDVHGMACHVTGMAEMAASPVEMFRQLRAAGKASGLFIDALTALQTAKHAHRSPEQLIELMVKVGPRAAKGRNRTPAFIRRRPMPDEQPVEETGTQTEPWTVGYLTDVILTRDTWMHRSDIAAAPARSMQLTADHDGVVVGDVVREWAQRHTQPCALTLTGPAGGTWKFGNGDGPSYTLDAIEFCRILSGRGSADGLLATRVPF